MSGADSQARLHSTELVVGATGLVGSHLVKTLLSEGHQVAALARRELKPRGTTGSGKLTVHRVNLELLCNAAAESSTNHNPLPFAQARTVYCCLGTTMKQAGSKAQFRRVDHDYVLAVAQLAKVAGVPQFHLVSAMGADAKSPLFYCRVKAEIEERLRSLKLPSLLIYRPSLLLGERKERRTAEQLGAGAAKLLGWTLRGPLRRYRPIPAKTVARAMHNVANNPRYDSGTTAFASDEIARLGK